jgi:hypothetical protein
LYLMYVLVGVSWQIIPVLLAYKEKQMVELKQILFGGLDGLSRTTRRGGEVSGSALAACTSVRVT